MSDRTIKIIIIVLAGAFILALFYSAICAWTVAEGEGMQTEAWIICNPDSWVNARRSAKHESEVTAYVPPCTKLQLDGKERNGYLHAVDMACEDPSGWVYKGFVIYSEPREDGHKYPVRTSTRVAAREHINGKIKHWLYDWDTVTVYISSDEWCITNYGFVKTEFIELETPLDIPVETMDPMEMTWEEDE